jgi:hypothetical protein
MENGTVAADQRRRGAGRAPRWATLGAGAVLGMICLAAVAGCSSSARPSASVSPTPTPTGTPSATAASQASASPSAAAPSSATPTASVAASASAGGAGGVPVLGQLAGDFAHGQGFGQVKPSRIFNGGDPSGLVTGVVWSSWGGAQATGTGTAEYLGPNQTIAQGTEEPATVVAFGLGTCDGKLMYQAIEWYFPQHGQSFSPDTYEDICTGSYVGSP